MNSKEIARLACEAMEDKKAQDIKIINIEQVSTLADYFIIASGSNRNQVQAMADNIDEVLGRAGIEAKQMEGYQSANWILIMIKKRIKKIPSLGNVLNPFLYPGLTHKTKDSDHFS